MELFHGNIIYSKNRDELSEWKDSYIAVEDGVVEEIYPRLPEKYFPWRGNTRIRNLPMRLMMPLWMIWWNMGRCMP